MSTQNDAPPTAMSTQNDGPPIDAEIVVPADACVDDDSSDISQTVALTERTDLKTLQHVAAAVKGQPMWLKVLQVLALLATIISVPLAIILNKDPPTPTPTTTAQKEEELPIEIKCGDDLQVITAGIAPFETMSCGGARVPYNNAAPGKWLSFAGRDGAVTISTCSDRSSMLRYDTRLRIFEVNRSNSGSGSDGDNLECVAGTDDDGSACVVDGKLSTVDFDSREGVTYYILVDGRSQSGGSTFLRVRCFDDDNVSVDPAQPETNPCNPNPCSNGGTCLPQSSTSGFACSCPPGYTGSRCATITTTTNNNVAQCSFLNASPTQAKLLPNDGAEDDLFGNIVAIDGDTIVVGAYYDDDNGSASGSAYLFTREGTGTAWRQQAKLLPDDGAASDYFGRSVAIDGGTIVVGAYMDDDNGFAGGSAYVFTRESTGTAWRQQAKLLPDDGAADDYFGNSVAIDGDTIVVGAYWDDDNGEDSGSAYVFTRESAGTAWRQQAKLLPDDGAATDRFGRSVAIDGDTIVIGANWDDDNGSKSGSAYVFTREGTGTAWRQQAKLLPDDGAASDYFGRSVAIDGGTIVVGADMDDDNGFASGSAYVFIRERTGTAWTQQDKLLPDDGAANDYFGRSVAIDGDTIVVGAWGDDDNGSTSGSAYVFTRESTGTAWRQQDKLLPNDVDLGDWFGYSVAIDGDTIAVGAYGDDDNGINSGSAYAFDFC